MTTRIAKADVMPVRQRTQYTCMSTSMMMALNALGFSLTEDEVNRVMGARAMKGASWEQALACAQHYGCRATLTMPSTVNQLKTWTDDGIPVMIAWNPEGRDWSHASLVFDVTDKLPSPIPAWATVISEKAEGGLWVWVADPNIPNPDKTTRIVSENDFYSKWYEKWPDYLVRRPACAIEREITEDGKQKPPTKTAHVKGNMMAAKKEKPITGPGVKPRNEVVQGLIERGQGGAGKHKDRGRDFERGNARKPKHPNREREANSLARLDWVGAATKLIASNKGTTERDLHYRAYLRGIVSGTPQPHLADKFPGARDARQDLIDMASKGKLAAYSGNPDGKPIYPNEIGHGTPEPLAGGTDVMRQLQNKLLHEQGGVQPQRPESPKVAQFSFNRHTFRKAARTVAAQWLIQQETK